VAELDELLEGNAAKPAREQLTLIRIFEEFRGRGYDGGYDALRRYARRWAKQHGEATAVRTGGRQPRSKRTCCNIPPLRSHPFSQSPRGPRTADQLRPVTLPAMLAGRRGQP
jgi:hypothetical protein